MLHQDIYFLLLLCFNSNLPGLIRDSRLRMSLQPFVIMHRVTEP